MSDYRILTSESEGHPGKTADQVPDAVLDTIADRCEIQISYAIGVAEPTSISVNTFGTGRRGDTEIVALVRKHFDLRPTGLAADAASGGGSPRGCSNRTKHRSRQRKRQ